MDDWRPQVPIDDETPWSRVVAWLKFVGPTKVVASVIGAVVALAVGWVLLRPGEPGAEATLGTLAPSSEPVSSSGDARDVEPDDSKLVVHVAGSVSTPGVYELVVGARVVDAVTAAGGALARAATDSVNLASRLEDGQRVYVPAVGEVWENVAVAGAEEASVVIDLNRASAEQLDRLPGVGPSTAAAIIAHRDEIGRFVGEEDLLAVPGIGAAKVAAWRGLISF